MADTILTYTISEASVQCKWFNIRREYEKVKFMY